MLAAIAVTCWFIFLPYPFAQYLNARKAAVYSPQWRISRYDYYAAKSTIQLKLSFYEIVERVAVPTPTRVEFWTLRHWEGKLAAGGRYFVVEKKNGRWVIVEHSSWVS